MNTKVKIALIIIVTLVIGVVLGAMLNRAFLRHRIHRAFSDRNPAGIVSFMEKSIRPTPNQREQIKGILEKHRIKAQEIREKFIEEMQLEFESLETELDPILTPEQKKRLLRSFGPLRNLRGFPDRRGPRGKPPREKPPKEQIK